MKIIRFLFFPIHFKLMPSRILKQYYWQLCTFSQCDSSTFKDMKQSSTISLYLYKQHETSIIVRLHSPTQKIHGWTFTQLQVCQKLNDNPKVSHWKSVKFPFYGELILSQLESFKKILNQQIEECIPRKTKQLQNWMKADIVDVFAISQKGRESFGNEHAFFQIKTIYRTRYINYFQMRRWDSDVWQGLLDIADAQKIEKTWSLGDLFEDVNNFINSFEVIRDEKYTNMFDLATNRKTTKRVPPKDEFQKRQERKILEKYRLYEYIQN